MRLAEILKNSIDEGARFDTFKTTIALQKYCSDAGWPTEVVNNLSIINNNNEHVIYYPPYLTSKVNDLEYGTISNPPSYVLRKFLNNVDDSAYAQGILEAMF